MSNFNIQRSRDLLQNFKFGPLFIEELGWSQPKDTRSQLLQINGVKFQKRQAAELSGVVVFEIICDDVLPDSKTRIAIQKGISKQHHENLLIFVDEDRTKCLWGWLKREDKKISPREHPYFSGQPGDLFLSKLSEMHVDIASFDENGNIPVAEVAKRLQKALDVKPVTKKFYQEFQNLHIDFLYLIKGIDNDRDRHWYASVILNRLMFIYFLQRKGFLDNGKTSYLQEKLEKSRCFGPNQYYEKFLKALFFEGFAKPEERRSAEAKRLLGTIKYLNGGLFLQHPIEIKYSKIQISDKAFQNLFKLFESYSWNLNDTPGGDDKEINPDVLGYIFEKYINQKAFGAYYTRPEITEYLCEHTIYKLILNKINSHGIPGVVCPTSYDSVPELLMNLDASLCRQLLNDVLPSLSLLDPACGSGAFLVAAMRTLINVYSAVMGKIEFLNDRNLSQQLTEAKAKHKSVHYFIKKQIITNNLFGVDIMEEATEIAKLRLFLALVAAVDSVDQLEPLPNIDFNIMTGNSLIGLMRIPENEFNTRDMFQKSYSQILEEKNRLIKTYRDATAYAEDLRSLRDSIEEKKKESIKSLNEILLKEFSSLEIKYEQATWDDKRKVQGKSVKRPLSIGDVEALHPFHWGFEFDEILIKREGFDAIITNPPWEVFEPQAKEFFSEYSGLISKNKMSITDFEKEQAKLLSNDEILSAWLEYQNRFPHVSQYYRISPHYQNQISIVQGKKAGSKINLYKLFLERCFHLLKEGGECGIVIPSGIYTDLGTKQLRELLFNETKIAGLFCLENKKEVFENVHRSFKIVVLTLEKGGKTKSFPAAFMRHDVEELSVFPKEGAITLLVDLIRQLSPDSCSLMEFKNEMDIQIAVKMSKFPFLGSDIGNSWKIDLTQEVNMTSDSRLFHTRSGNTRAPLIQGNTINQFEADYGEAKYWIELKEGRRNILGKEEDREQILSYETYRLVHRRIARNTDSRTLIAAVLPPNRFCADTAQTVRNILAPGITLYLTALFNSFAVDSEIRRRVTGHCDMHFVYALRIPRIMSTDNRFIEIIRRAAKLTCVTPEYDDLAKEVGLGSYKNGVRELKERAKIRAELDGLIAHLYGMTEEEFTYILTTFPIVPQEIKDAAMSEYRVLAPKSGDEVVAQIMSQGESASVEFKSSARWDMETSQVNKELEKTILKTVASLLNTDQGGTLLIGVNDGGVAVGLDHDYKTIGKKKNRDGYENFLMTIFLNTYGKDCAPLIEVTFHSIDGKDVCCVTAKPSPRAVFIKDDKGEHLFIRAGNSTRLLSTKEAIDYCKFRWS